MRAQGDVELLVIDSGSRDRSREIARAAGADADRDRAGGVRARPHAQPRSGALPGELICFLTQDAVPEPGWLDAYREAFELDARVGAAFGPHLPWDDTSPMIARELDEFFGGFSPDGGRCSSGAAICTFLSNVNACYSRACWEEIRFPELAYAEDQAFGRAMLDAGWVKVFHPGAAVRHAHDYGPVGFMKRYFDEYRGLREASGHVEPLAREPRSRGARGCAGCASRAGRRGGDSAGWRARLCIRAAGARRRRSARAPIACRAAAQARCRSRRAGGRRPDPLPRGRQVAARPETPFEEVLRFSREGPAPLDEPVAGMSERPTLHVAVVIPPFQRGSGGHSTIFTLIARLEHMGHTCSIWLHDPCGREQRAPAVLRREIVDHFIPVRAPVFKGFDDWYGADVAVATGWDTAYAAVMLPGCRARAYLINDHEPEFFATSAEAMWAGRTYELGLYGISASRWLRDLLARYGQRGSWFRLGVDHERLSPSVRSSGDATP